MQSSQPPAAATLVVTCNILAQPSAVYNAWTSESLLSKWFTLDDGLVTVVHIQPIIAGDFLLVQSREDQLLLHYSGTYLALEPPERLSFSLLVPEYFLEEVRVDVIISPAEKGSLLHLTQTGGSGGFSKSEWKVLLTQLKLSLEYQ